MTDAGNMAQMRKVAEQVADAAYEKFAKEHPEVRRGTVVSEIPAPLKWAAAIFSAIISVAATGGLIWLVTSVSEMSVTLARLDERMVAYTESQNNRIDELERRTGQLERYHREGGE